MIPLVPPDVRASSLADNLKLSSPQKPMQYNEMKAGIFRGKVIIVAGGKQSLSEGMLQPEMVLAQKRQSYK